MKLLLYFCLALSILTSCKKVQSDPPGQTTTKNEVDLNNEDDAKTDTTINTFDGTFKGNIYLFNHVYPTIVKFTDKKYSSSNSYLSQPMRGEFAHSSGTIELSAQNKIIFYNIPRPYSADFAGGLVLDGEYTYSFKNDSLILDRTVPNLYLRYKLKWFSQ